MQNLIRINWHQLRIRKLTLKGQGEKAPVPFSNCAFSFQGLFSFQWLFLAALGHWDGIVAAADCVFLVLLGGIRVWGGLGTGVLFDEALRFF